MSLKFEKDRSVSFAYFNIPMYYTGIIHPKNPNKELVILDRFGKHYVAAWRNEEIKRDYDPFHPTKPVDNHIGINFLVKRVDTKNRFGFIFKDKFYSLRIKRKGRARWVF